jgi:hypothetical protein
VAFGAHQEVGHRVVGHGGHFLGAAHTNLYCNGKVKRAAVTRSGSHASAGTKGRRDARLPRPHGRADGVTSPALSRHGRGGAGGHGWHEMR